MSFLGSAWNWTKNAAIDFGDYLGHAASNIYRYGRDLVSPLLGGGYSSDNLLFDSDSAKGLSDQPQKGLSDQPQSDLGVQYSNPEMQFNAIEAQKNRDWQEYMSNTAYSRAIADLKKNGINPYAVLSGFNGASTPGGSSASYSGYESSKLSSKTSIINSVVHSLSALGFASLKFL